MKIKEMTSNQNIKQVITQAVIEAAKAAILVERDAKGPAENRRAVQTAPRANGPTLRQQTFNWKVQDKFNELNHFKIELNIIFLINSYNIEENVKV